MTANIECPTRAPRDLLIKVCVEDALLAIERSGGDCAGGLDHNGVAVVDPFFRLEELVALGKVERNIAALHCSCGADHPAAGFPGDVAHGDNPALAGVPCGSHIDLDGLGIERIARERHVAFPADERSNSPSRLIYDPQTLSISHPPNHAFPG